MKNDEPMRFADKPRFLVNMDRDFKRDERLLINRFLKKEGAASKMECQIFIHMAVETALKTLRELWESEETTDGG